MTKQEIYDSIKVTKIDNEDCQNSTRFVARFTRYESIMAANLALQSEPRLESDIAENLKMRLMRSLFEQASKEVHEAMMDLFELKPFDYEAMDKARQRILKALSGYDYRNVKNDKPTSIS